MQRVTEHNQATLRAGLSFNAGAPVAGLNRAQGLQQMSFANQLAQVKNEAAAQRDLQDLSNLNLNNPQAEHHTGTKAEKKTQTGIFASANLGDQKLSEEQILKSLRREEFSREQEMRAATDTEMQSSSRLSETLTNSEAVKATLAQAHQGEVHNAVKEGNVGERDAQHHNANDRKKQLANWEELAPSITEDIKNRAVRIDIPGLIDIETLIVRMQKNQVMIQAVGKDSVMQSLQGREAELKSRLASKNVQLGTLQAFDARKLATGKRA